MITILTPTYNRAELLKSLFASLCSQTCFDFEWLIVDDGSTDDTSLVVKTFKSDKFPIRYYLKENGGKVQDVKVNGVSVVANKVANIDLTSKADATALTEVSTAVESKADNAALSKEIEDRKSEIARVEGKIPTDTLSADELTKDEKAIAAAFQEIKINYDAQQLTINNLKKKVQEASKNQGSGNVDDVKVDGVSVVANKIANINLSTKADATALTQVSEAIETKADTTAVTQVSTALTQEVTDRKAEITRVDGKISDEAAA